MDKIKKLQVETLKEYWILIFGMLPEKHVIDMWKKMSESERHERIGFWMNSAKTKSEVK